MGIDYSERKDLPLQQIVALYRANGWSSAAKAEILQNSLRNSHSLISAWKARELVGLGNAISDGYLVVYYPHLLIHPDYQRMGVGTEIMRRLMQKYQGFHQHMLVVDGGAVEFMKNAVSRARAEPSPCGFTRAEITECVG